MEVNQIYSILNDVMGEVTGLPIASKPSEDPDAREYIVKEDLSNVVTIGDDVFDREKNWKDNYVKSLIDRIGRDVFVNRTYEGYAPDILMDRWEYGSIMAKHRCKIFAAKPNPSWSLQKGQTVNQFEYVPPEVSQKFFNDKDAWQIECSFTAEQLRESFKSPAALNEFYSMIENMINVSKTIYLDSLKMRTINNYIGEKLYENNGVIDALAGYNMQFGQSLTAMQAYTNKDFLRYLAAEIKNYIEFIKTPTAAFNISDDPNGTVNFTPKTFAKLIVNTRIETGISVYLQSDTYHDELVKLDSFESVPYWQTEGNKFDIANTTRIDIKLASSKNAGTTREIDRNHIIGVLFDRDALGVLNDNQRTTTAYNANGEYWTNFYKVDTEYFNSLEENGLVFVLGNGIPAVQTLPMIQDEKIWDYDVSDLQSADFTVNNITNKISGTLNYISTGALPPTWGNGHFMALRWFNIPDDATSCKVGINNFVEIIDDPDRNGTIMVTDTSKKFKIVTTTPRGVNTQEYDLTGLTLAAAPQQTTRKTKAKKEEPAEGENVQPLIY